MAAAPARRGRMGAGEAPNAVPRRVGRGRGPRTTRLRPQLGAVPRGVSRGRGGQRPQLVGGEAGIRLVLQRLAPSTENLERLAALIGENAQDERCELMWGSLGTILAGRELGLDVIPSLELLGGQCGQDGLWTQRLYDRMHR